MAKDFFYDLAYKKLLLNFHSVLEIETSQSVITNPIETDKLGNVSG